MKTIFPHAVDLVQSVDLSDFRICVCKDGCISSTSEREMYLVVGLGPSVIVMRVESTVSKETKFINRTIC